MDNVYVLGGLRSYIGIKNSAYRHVPAEQLGAAVLKELAGKYPLHKADMIIGGNSVGCGGNITRLAALDAGLPSSIPSLTIDQQCASSLAAITTAAAMIESGLAGLVIAGGFESTSTQPLRMRHPNHPDFTKDCRPYTTARFIPGPQYEDVMLQGAERTICHHHVQKEELDSWTLISHQRALRAREDGVLKDVVCPVCGLDMDEGIRPRMSQKLIDRLPPVLKDGRYLNAANACSMNDGAAFILLCSGQYLKDHGLTPRCRLSGAFSTGADPLMSPVSAVASIQQLLERTHTSMDEIGCVECNEAFAVIDVLFQRAYPDKCSHYNMFGGALAYGHPYGASGAIIFLHLMKAMELTGSRKGICSVAAAGGIGTAVLLRSV